MVERRLLKQGLGFDHRRISGTGASGTSETAGTSGVGVSVGSRSVVGRSVGSGGISSLTTDVMNDCAALSVLSTVDTRSATPVSTKDGTILGMSVVAGRSMLSSDVMYDCAALSVLRTVEIRFGTPVLTNDGTTLVMSDTNDVARLGTLVVTVGMVVSKEDTRLVKVPTSARPVVVCEDPGFEVEVSPEDDVMVVYHPVVPVAPSPRMIPDVLVTRAMELGEELVKKIEAFLPEVAVDMPPVVVIIVPPVVVIIMPPVKVEA